MATKPRPFPAPPDGTPKAERGDRDSTARSRVSEAQDPLISGDAGRKGRNADEPSVDEAGEVERKDPNVDLLH